MQFDAECIACLVRRQYELAERQPDRAAQTAFMRDVARTIADAPENVAAPWLVPGFARAAHRHFGITDAFDAIKRESNDRVLALLPRIREIVGNADDPLAMALKFSRTGNYLDFAVLPHDKIARELDSAVENTPSEPLNDAEYAALRADLSRARSLLILGDNAGEIAFDVVLVEQLQRQYPALRVQYVVRGGNAQNDATRADAHAVGMDALVPILDNGSCIPGTELAYCGETLLREFSRADVILSKGQGNFECLLGCGQNVYYLFLCKCPRLCRILSQPLMQPMLLNDRRIQF